MERNRSSTNRWDYVDLIVEIREGSHPKYPLDIRSPQGKAREEMHFPFDREELEEKLDDVERAVLLSGRSRRRGRRLRSREVQTVQEFGQALFEALLHGEVRTHFDESLRRAKRQNKGLRLKLHIQPSELATVPWEFLYDPDSDSYLCLSSKTPLVRYVKLSEPVEQLPVKSPLRILGMVASPLGLERLNVEKEKRRVREAVRELEAEGRVALTWLEGQTQRDLLRAMSRGPWHIFHFIGHGEFDPKSEEGLIALADSEGDVRYLNAENLAQLLKDHWDLRLVLLNSCVGARGSEQDAFSSTAATLVRPGIPAVVANQYEITDDAAIEFSRAFYEAVADGLPVDAAVARARTSIKIEIDDTLEWATPVLYMRAPDGHIFDISAEPAQEEVGYRQGEGPLHQYRESLESAWAGEGLDGRKAERLRDLANSIGLDPSIATDIEREVMGDTIGVILERQERVAREEEAEEERRKRLDELYAQARRSHRDREWQAVVDLFDQIETLDPTYSDPEELLDSARVALAALGTSITALNTDRIRLLRALEGHTKSVESVAFSPDGQLLASCAVDKTVRLWRVNDGALLRMLEGHTKRVESVAFSPDGQLLASCAADKTVRLWRVNDGALLRMLEGHTDWVRSVAFSPDGQLLASGAWDSTVRLWWVVSGTLKHIMNQAGRVLSIVQTLTFDVEGHHNVKAVAFSPDGQMLALGVELSGATKREVRLWRVESGALMRRMRHGSQGSWWNINFSVAFSPDGRLLASGSYDKTVYLWRVEDGALLRTLEGHTNYVNSVMFSPDGQLLVSGAADKTVRLWRVEDGALLRTLEGHTDIVESVAFSPDGQLLASCATRRDTTVRLWGIA